MIRDRLVRRIEERFAGRAVRFGVSPGAVVVFAAQHAEVGDVEIFDDGGEVTLVAGHFTHGHFSDFDSVSAEEAETRVADDVVEFLDRLFADQIVMWGFHRGKGGWYDRSAGRPAWVEGPLYVWSGPLGGGVS